MELRITIHDPRTGADEEAFFRTSPIRIGRNALNDLLLDEPSVSQWHAQLVWGEQGVWFTDIGSSNGSAVGPSRVAANSPVPIDEHAIVEVGPMKMRVARVEQPDATRARRLPFGGAMPEEVLTAMSTIDIAGADVTSYDDELATQASDDGAQTAVASSAIAQLQYLRAALAALAPARAAYLEELREQIEGLPTPARAKIVPQLAREFPELASSPEFLELARRCGVEHLGTSERGARERLEALIGAPLLASPGEEISDDRILARVTVLLQTFAQSLFELMRAKEHVVRELGLGGGDRVPSSGQDILAYLFDFRVDGEERVSSLARVFADLAMHQMAMVAATRDGVRSLVEEIAPSTITQRAQRSGGRTGSWRDLLPFGGMQLWEVYRRAHADLAEGDRFARHVFGPRFGRSYLAMTGRPGQP
nr:FHA domain-containing protein [Myxococcota bacterium]